MESAPAAASTAPRPDVDAMLAALAVGLGKSAFPASESQDLLGQVAQAYGHPAEFTVMSTLSIVGDPRTGRVRMQAIDGAYRFDQVEAVQGQLSRALSGKVPANEIAEALQKIDALPAPRAAWKRIAGYGLATIGFAAAVRLELGLLPLALVLGLLVGTALVLVDPKSRGGVLLPITATFASALVVGLVTEASGLDDPVRLAAVPVLLLIPGAAITASVVELVNGHMVAGSSRLVYAVMQLLAMGFAFALAIDLAGVPTADLVDLSTRELPAWAAWVGALAFTIGLAIHGCLSRRLWVDTAAIALFAFTAQQAGSLWLATPLAGGVAAALALLAASVLNRRHGLGPEVMVLFIPAFWLIVPGSVGFTALTGVLTHNESLSALGPQTGLTFLAMAIGIMVASLIWSALVEARRQVLR
jgi:uncharacterized membrane protein YjjP (DUF1212 family)